LGFIDDKFCAKNLIFGPFSQQKIFSFWVADDKKKLKKMQIFHFGKKLIKFFR